MAIPIKIKSINLIAEYNYNSINTMCFCKKELKENLKDEIYQGHCGHSFHKSCILQNQILDLNCPLCESKWTFNKNLNDNSVYLYKA